MERQSPPLLSMAPAGDSSKYFAFISYSHADRHFADWLHQRLERFPVAKDLAGQRTANGGTVPSRLYPVFRDREELPTATDLGTLIRGALAQSRYLIVVCSPRAAQSPWVEKEILYYKQLGREDRVLCIIIDGEPNASEGKPGCRPEDECFPSATRFRIGADGELTAERSEPIAADARERGDGKHNALLKLAAGLLGVDYDSLKRRDDIYQRAKARRLRATVAAFAVLALGALLLWFFAVRQRNEAQAQRQIAQRTLSASDFLNAEKRLESEDARENREGCAYLARSIRLDQGNLGAATRLLALLSQVNYSEVARLTPALEHGDAVISVAFSPDGERIATGSRDMTARVWNAATGAPLTRPLKHANGVARVSFSPDGERLLTRSPDTVTCVWDARNGELLVELKHSARVSAAEFSPDGNLVATGTHEGQVSVWDSRRGVKVSEFQAADLEPLEFTVEYLRKLAEEGITIHEDGSTTFSRENIGKLPVPTKPLRVKRPSSDSLVQVLHFSPDGHRLLTAAGELVAIREVTTGKQLASFFGHEDTVYVGAFSRDGLRVATGSKDGTARIWDVATGRALIEPIAHDNAADKVLTNKIMTDMDTVSHVEFSPGGDWLVTACANGEARVWDAETGEAVSPPMRHESEIHVARFSPDGTRIVTASTDSNVIVWDALQGTLVAGPLPHSGSVFDAAFSPDGKRVASGTASFIEGVPGTAQIWDARMPFIVPAFRASVPVTDAQMTVSGGILATIMNDGTVRLWETTTARALGELLRGPAPIRVLSFSPGGAQIVTGATDGNVQLWDARTGKPTGEPLAHPQELTAVDWSANGERILTTCSDNSARLWDVSTRRLLGAPMHLDGLLGDSRFTADGTEFVLAGAQKAELRDARTGRIIREFAQPTRIERASIARRRATLALVGVSEVQLWDTRAGTPLGSPLQHRETYTTEIDGTKWQTSRGFSSDTSPIGGAVFNSDGTRLLTWALNRAARVWDSATGKPLTDSLRHPVDLIDADISADGRQVLTVGEDGDFHLWDTGFGRPLNSQSLNKDDPVKKARFSPDGRWIILTSTKGVLHLLPHISTAEPIPTWLADLAEVFARSTVTENGAFLPLERSPGAIVSEVRSRLQNDPSYGSWTRFGRWLLDDLGARTFSPFATLPLRDYLRDALQDPRRALEAAALARATGHGDLASEPPAGDRPGSVR